MRRGALFFVSLLLPFCACSQIIIKGVLLDSANREPIAFAYLTLEDGKTGTSTEIEGNFSLRIPLDYKGEIIISHISYQPKRVSIAYLKENPVITLVPISTVLQEVEITASKEENPAFRLIREAVAHKKDHNPDFLKSYEYISYNKYLITMTSPKQPFDTVLAHIHNKDSTKQVKARKDFVSFDSLLKTSHFFLSESVTEKQKINPDKEKEKLLALKVSGFKSPLFTNVATDYQPFSFYKDNISLLGKDYINPISKGTFSRYDFQLSDTAYSGTDTIFIIRYKPKPNSFFSALKGIISISTDGFAIKNVIASSADTLALTGIFIQQNYEKVDGHWFPVQLNTDIHFYKYEFFSRHMLAQHRSFLKEIKINPVLNPSSFGDVKVDLTLPKPDENTLALNRFRNATLDKKETRTFTFVDSVMKKVKWLDKAIEMFVTQAVPLGPLELDLNRISRFNQYESYRLGAGLYTSNRFSKWFRLGGYAGYGFRDERWKYGGSLRFNFNQNKDFFLQFSYAKDIYETGAFHDLESQLLGPQSFRTLVSSRYDRIEYYKAEMGYRIMPDVHATVFASRNQIQPTYNYQLQFNNELLHNFLIAETGFTVRYVKDETYMSLRGKKIFLGQRFPVVTFSFVKASSLFDAQDFNYSRMDFTAKQIFKHRNGNKTRLFLAAGMINGLAPYGKLYNGRGASITQYLVDDYFQTMGLYEFSATQFASIFLQHNFGNVLLNKKFTKPELLIYQNAGIGQLANASNHIGLTLQSFDKGFVESGVGLNNIIRGSYARVAYWGFGGALFYRYGAYQLANSQNNLFTRLTFNLSF